MELFQLSRANDVRDAIVAGAASQTAQQGAQVRFLAGGGDATTTFARLARESLVIPGEDTKRLGAIARANGL